MMSTTTVKLASLTASVLLFVMASACFGRTMSVLFIENKQHLEELFNSGEINQQQYHHLARLLDNPVDLNSASVDDLLEIPFVTPVTARRIVSIRRELSGFASLYDLVSVKGITAFDAERIKPFVIIRESTVPSDGFFDFDLNSVFQESLEGGRFGYVKDANLQSIVHSRARWQSGYQLDLLFAHRIRTESEYDRDVGLLSSPGSQIKTELERFSFFYNAANPRFILGHYHIGFAQRLTLDSSGLYQPGGWVNRPAFLYHHNAGRYELLPAFFGGAFTQELQLSRFLLSYSLFVSKQSQDLKKRHLRYGADPWQQAFLGDCEQPGAVKGPFQCEGDGRWYTSSVVDGGDIAQPLGSVVIEDAFHEQLAGSHIALGNRRHRVGILRYDSEVAFNMPVPEVRFSNLARYPNDETLHATGVYYTYQGAYTLATEWSQTQNNGMAGYSRLELGVFDRWFVTLAGRYYNRHFANPHSNGEAMPVKTLGTEQRNEQGLRFTLDGLFSFARVQTTVDAWQHPYEYGVEDQWRKIDHPPVNVFLSHGWSGSIYSRAQWGVLFQFINRDIEHNGRSESFTNTDVSGRGERRKIELNLRWQPRPVHLGIGYVLTREDVAAVARFFDTRTIRTHMSIKHRFGMKYGLYGQRRFYSESANNFPGDRRPQWQASAFVDKRFNKHWRWRSRIGVLAYPKKNNETKDRVFEGFLELVYQS